MNIQGVSPDTEVVTNEQGGKQSASQYAFHLIDPDFLFELQSEKEYTCFIDHIAEYMKTRNKDWLLRAVLELGDFYDTLFKIAKVLKYGEERYKANNWRLIPQEDHLNHALIHYYAFKVGDKQDDHLSHCLCRLMMAYATECSNGFCYDEYIVF